MIKQLRPLPDEAHHDLVVLLSGRMNGPANRD